MPQLTDEQLTLRALVRLRARLVEDRVRLTNRLEELLGSYFPALLELTQDLSQRWFLQLLLWAATPAKTRKLSLVKLLNLLKKYRIQRLNATQVRQILAKDPLPGVSLESPPQTFEVQCLAQQITLAVEQIKACEKQMTQMIEALRADHASHTEDAETPAANPFSDVDILRSIPGLGPMLWLYCYQNQPV